MGESELDDRRGGDNVVEDVPDTNLFAVLRQSSLQVCFELVAW